MGLKDLVFTPLVILFVMAFAYLIRPYFTNNETRRFFIPALVVRITCAILLGILYQYYYSWGDTYNYHTLGSVQVREIILDDPVNGIKLLFSNGDPTDHPYKYISRVPYFKDSSAFFVIRVATFFDMLTFGTYSATAVFFALISFTGAWLMYKVFYDLAPQRNNAFAFAILFLPSLVFWGSGILKDTLTLAAVGVGIYTFYYLFIKPRNQLINLTFLLLSFYVLYSVKIYILLSFIPPLALWAVLHKLNQIRSVILRWLLLPAVLGISITSVYFLVVIISEDSPRYSIDNLAKTAQITAYDIAFWTGKDSGSTYVLGELDGTYESLLRLAPEAVNVSLFRPYFWEVQNPLMLLAASESLFILIFTLYILIKSKIIYLGATLKPITIACLLFSIMLAFAVGVSTFNFGSLSRYKIPLLPFYLSALIMIYDELNRLRKGRSVVLTE